MKKIVVKSVIVCSLLSTAVFVGINSNEIAAENKYPEDQVMVQNELIKDKKLNEKGSIKYTAVLEKGRDEIDVLVAADANKVTKEELVKYKEKMPDLYKKLKKSGIEEVPATVTFNKTVSLENFEKLIRKNGLELERFYVRTLDENGIPGTVSGIPTEEGLLDREILESMTTNGPVKLDIAGIYAFETKLKTEKSSFEQLVSNPNIFAVDVSEKIVEKEVKASKKFKEEKSKNPKLFTDVDVHNLFWALEKVD